jgi:hypothetical protein
LSDKFSYDAEHEDTHTILEAMIIKKYLGQQKQKIEIDLKRMENTPKFLNAFPQSPIEQIETNVCMQLLRYESITHYELSLSKEETKNDEIICIESLKLSVLAKSCICPGLVVMITNLIKSSGEPYPELNQKKDDPDYNWLHSYWTGKGFEIYRVPIPATFVDKSFCDIASDVYKNTTLLLFAVEIEVNNKPSGEILLNPGNYKLPKPLSKHNRYDYYGYLVADG